MLFMYKYSDQKPLWKNGVFEILKILKWYNYSVPTHTAYILIRIICMLPL